MATEKQKEAARRNIKKAQAALRGEIKKGGSRTTEKKGKKRRAGNRKIGVMEAASEVGGLIIGASQVVQGNIATGVGVGIGGLVLAKAIRWAARGSEVHKYGIKVGRKKELVIA